MTEDTVSFEWSHGIGDVVGCLLGAGLRLDSFVEHDVGPWRRFHGMTEAGDGWWHLESGRPRVPVTYSLRAVKS